MILMLLACFFLNNTDVEITLIGDSEIKVFVNNKEIKPIKNIEGVISYSLKVSEKDKISVGVLYNKLSFLYIYKNKQLVTRANITKDLIIKFKKEVVEMI